MDWITNLAVICDSSGYQPHHQYLTAFSGDINGNPKV